MRLDPLTLESKQSAVMAGKQCSSIEPSPSPGSENVQDKDEASSQYVSLHQMTLHGLVLGEEGF